MHRVIGATGIVSKIIPLKSQELKCCTELFMSKCSKFNFCVIILCYHSPLDFIQVQARTYRQ